MSSGIHFISGKPGGGKSLLATYIVLERLKATRKRVVTNLPLDVARVREYLIGQTGTDRGYASRIRLLSPEETPRFWLFYGLEETLDPDKRKEIKLGSGKVIAHLDFADRFHAAAKSAVRQQDDLLQLVGSDRLFESEIASWTNPDWDGSILYVIDEAHEFFNAREWKETGLDALHYLSQHRKLGDEVLFVTQHVRNCDTQLRRVAQDFTYVKNLKKVKLPMFFGLFRAPQVFVRSTYLEEKTGMMQEPMEMQYFKLDAAGVASCYATAQGVGIAGTAADTNDKPKGLPFSILIGLGLALVLLFVLGWFFTRKKLKDSFTIPAAAKEQQVLVRKTASVTPVVESKIADAPAVQQTNKIVRISGWSFDPNSKGMIIFLDDGRQLRNGFKFVDRDTVEHEGKRYSRVSSTDKQ